MSVKALDLQNSEADELVLNVYPLWSQINRTESKRHRIFDILILFFFIELSQANYFGAHIIKIWNYTNS